MLSFLALLISFIFGEQIQIAKNSLIINYGWAQPLFGDFGDFDSGFRGNFSYSFLYLRDYDDLISYGFAFGDTFFLKNRPTGLKIKFFSAGPLISFKSNYKKDSLIFLGMGIYHWSSPSKGSYVSTSDDDFGFKFGYNKMVLNKKIKISFNIEWNYIIGVRGRNFDLGNINLFTPSISLRYDFK